MKVLVTGGTGFLGGHVVKELLKRGYEVILPHRNQLPKRLSLPGVFPFKVDIIQREELKPLVKQSEFIIHVAADTSMFPSDSPVRKAVNITSTRNLVELANEFEVERMVYVSTVNVFRFGDEENPGSEEERLENTDGLTDYIKTKFVAQQLVEKSVKEEGLNAIILNPCFMLGEEDYKPSSGLLVKSVLEGKVPVSTNGGKNVIYVKDVAGAVCNALKMGRIGESYILANTNISYTKLFKMIAEVGEVKPPKITLPDGLVKTYGAIGSLMEKNFNKEPQLNLAMAKIACEKHYYKADKARKELNLEQTPIEEVIQRTVNWFKKA